MKKLFFILFNLWIIHLVNAQVYDGVWTGLITQDNKPGSFFYQINIKQEGNSIKGTSYSKNKDASAFASFQIAGVIENGELVLQEVLQIEPKGSTWCMKHLRLKLDSNDLGSFLVGSWDADNCSPGKVRLEQKRNTIKETELPLEQAILGKWTGRVSQSDRDYGFYFETVLEEGPNGTSYIVSEDNGGTCTHRTNWTFDGENISFQEISILKKSDSKWPWCMKTANMQLRKDSLKYILEGEWEGYIEGFTKETGACAPGKIYLEKPIIIQKEVIEETNMEVYEVEEKREIQVNQILEVKSETLRIKVWDNGIVDGDVLTLFLNGDKIMEKHRVTKYKRAVIVKLKEETNLLILHAEDLGDIMPNTVAVSIDDGHKEQLLILSSNLRESGAVMVKHFKLED